MNMPGRRLLDTPFGKRKRYERAARLYLERCYATRSAARASEFAEFVGLTRAHLSVEVKRLFGVGPREFLRNLQLDHACWLLRATPARPAVVAVAAAFGTVSTFYRVFTARYGTSPDQYREQFHRTK